MNMAKIVSVFPQTMANSAETDEGSRAMILTLMDSMKTGHDDIDDDHALIIDTLNVTQSTIISGGNTKAAHALVDRFIRICEAHFQREERILSEAGYPDVHDHCAEHLSMLERAHAARQRFLAADDIRERLEHLDDLTNALIEDIVQSDTAFVSFLQARGLVPQRT